MAADARAGAVDRGDPDYDPLYPFGFGLRTR